jgi:hypothetical protein
MHTGNEDAVLADVVLEAVAAVVMATVEEERVLLAYVKVDARLCHMDG